MSFREHNAWLLSRVRKMEQARAGLDFYDLGPGRCDVADVNNASSCCLEAGHEGPHKWFQPPEGDV